MYYEFGFLFNKFSMLRSPGLHEISNTSKHGKSLLYYEPNFIEDPMKCNSLMNTLLRELPWKQQSGRTSLGEVFTEPRFTSWYSDHNYYYSKIKHKANPIVS